MIPSYIEKAIVEYIPNMQGWSEPARCCEMAECILETKAQICLDVGVFAGRSTIAMGFAARQLNTSMVYGIDPWDNRLAEENDDRKEGIEWWKNKVDLEDIHRQAMKAVWDHHLEPWVTIIRAKSEHVYKLFPVLEFLNVDGGHSEATSCRDVELYLPRLKSGCYLMFDDCGWPSTQKALKMVEEQCELTNTFKGIGDSEARTYRKR